MMHHINLMQQLNNTLNVVSISFSYHTVSFDSGCKYTKKIHKNLYCLVFLRRFAPSFKYSIMKRLIIFGVILCLSQGVYAQGCNTSMGGNDGNYQSLAERFSLIEKKNDMFNLYLNFSASGRTLEEGDGWHTGFANKELRLEIKGNLTDKLFYRLRHRLNKSNNAKSEDNFAKATDMMMVGYNFSDKFTLMAGKITQIWGGFEYDENPMFIYQYSDIVGYADIFLAGAAVLYNPSPTQEFIVNVTNSYSGKFADEYGAGAITAEGQPLEGSRHPLCYIFNWNSSYFDGLLKTRWAVASIWASRSISPGSGSISTTSAVGRTSTGSG